MHSWVIKATHSDLKDAASPSSAGHPVAKCGACLRAGATAWWDGTGKLPARSAVTLLGDTER